MRMFSKQHLFSLATQVKLPQLNHRSYPMLIFQNGMSYLVGGKKVLKF